MLHCTAPINFVFEITSVSTDNDEVTINQHGFYVVEAISKQEATIQVNKHIVVHIHLNK